MQTQGTQLEPSGFEATLQTHRPTALVSQLAYAFCLNINVQMS